MQITIERQLVERAVSALTNEFPPTQLITALRAALAAQPAPAAVPPDEKLLALAREYASVVYTNRHFPDTPAFSFPTGKLLSFARAVLATGDKP